MYKLLGIDNNLEEMHDCFRQFGQPSVIFYQGEVPFDCIGNIGVINKYFNKYCVSKVQVRT